MSSVCSSEFCQEKVISPSVCAIPSMSNQESSSSETFIRAVEHWLTGSWYATCSRRLKDPLPPDEFVRKIS